MNWFELPLEERQKWILEQEKRINEMTSEEHQEFLCRQSVTPINRIALLKLECLRNGTEPEVWLA